MRRIEKPYIVLVMESKSEFTTITIREVEELKTYNQPQSPGRETRAYTLYQVSTLCPSVALVYYGTWTFPMYLITCLSIILSCTGLVIGKCYQILFHVVLDGLCVCNVNDLLSEQKKNLFLFHIQLLEI